MNTISFSSESITRKELLRSILRFLGFMKQKAKPAEVPYFGPAAWRAMRTVRMALNPGEVYGPKVAARIRREAVAYDEFLRNPKKIGRIVLNVKEFSSAAADTCVSREHIRIYEPIEGLKNPAEGLATVWKNFERSQNKVLEFLLYDENDETLFPIVRTYTDWVGTKEIALGPDRSLYLTAFEGKSGYVRVGVGFDPIFEPEKVFSPDPARPPQLEPWPVLVPQAAPGIKPGLVLGLRLAALAVVGMATIAMLTATAVVHSFAELKRARQSQANNSQWTPRIGNWFPMWDTTKAPADTHPAPVKPVPEMDQQKIVRLADIRRVKVSIDKKSCRESEGCLEVLTGMEQNLKSRLAHARLSILSDRRSVGHGHLAELRLSYEQIDTVRGRVHLTLSDDKGSLWNTDHEIAHTHDAWTMNLYSDKFSAEILLSVINASLAEPKSASTTSD